MITDDELAQLPEDPELAFVQFERIVRDRLNENLRDAENHESESYQLEYMNKVIAAAKVFDLTILREWEVPSVNGRVWENFRQFSADVDHYTMQIRILHTSRTKKYSVALDQPTKAKIRHFIELIKDTIEKAQLTVDKADTLYRKLNDFAVEVDKTRTLLQSGMAAFIAVCDAIGQGAEKLEPARKMIDSISTLMGRAKAIEEHTTPSLSAPAKLKRLTAPRKEPPPSSNLDDEIPF
jgi:hypothetical protein